MHTVAGSVHGAAGRPGGLLSLPCPCMAVGVGCRDRGPCIVYRQYYTHCILYVVYYTDCIIRPVYTSRPTIRRVYSYTPAGYILVRTSATRGRFPGCGRCPAWLPAPALHPIPYTARRYIIAPRYAHTPTHARILYTPLARGVYSFIREHLAIQHIYAVF